MKENKLGVLLESFKDEDWKAYQKFAKSRYSDTSDCKKIIDFIKKHKSRYNAKNLDSEFLRKKIRPSAKPIVFSNVISQLCKHIEAYFVWAEVMDDPMMEDTLLLKAFAKRGLTNQFHKQKKKATEKREEMPLGLWKHYHEFMGEYLEYFCNMTLTVQTGAVVLDSTINNLIEFYSVLHMYLFLEVTNRKVLLKEPWNNANKLDFTSKSKSQKLNLIFKNLVNAKTNQDKNSFSHLKALLIDKSISNEIRHTILIHLLSFISKENISKGQNKYTEMMTELQEFGIQENLLFPSGKIPFSRYLNIIHRACYSKHYDWAINFTLKYSDRVFNDKKYQTKAVGIAYIEFSRGNFKEVINILSTKKFFYIGIEYRAKWLLLSSNYELAKNDLSILEYDITNFKYYINRNKKALPSATHEGLKNSANYLLRIAKFQKGSKELLHFRKNQQYLFRTWLNKKADEKIKG